MQLTLPPATRILVLAPHPDDESLGCGGTVARYTQGGATAALLVVSDGGALDEQDGKKPEDLAAERAQETRAAAQVLGIQHVSFLGLPDGRLNHHGKEIDKALRQNLVAFTPDIVFCPSPIDGHCDHAAVARVMLQLHREVPGWSLAFYELHTPLRPNLLVDISEVINVKEQAVRCYHRSLFGRPEFFWSTVRGLNESRSFFVHQPGFYEALWITRTPLTDQEVIDWTTFDFRPQPGEALTLPTVKGMDALLAAIKEKTEQATTLQQQLNASQQVNEELQQQLHAQTAALSALHQDLETRTQDLHYLRTHFLTWARQFLRYHIDGWLPVGTRMRAILQRVNRLRRQYTSKSLKE